MGFIMLSQCPGGVAESSTGTSATSAKSSGRNRHACIYM